MGDAWFMGESRRLFVELQGDLQSIDIVELDTPLEEIVVGTISFGPSDEWQQWYHYLLAHLTARSHDGQRHALLEWLISGFVSQHPDRISPEPYPGFRRDVLDTLGQCLMDARCWPSGALDTAACFNHAREPSSRTGDWFHASGKFSSSMFLCIKYLETSDIRAWLTSVLRIDDPRWRAQLMLWCVGANDLLSGRIRHPSAFSPADYPRIDWQGSRCLTGSPGRNAAACDFIHPAQREAVVDTLQSFMTEATFLAWLQSLCQYERVETELGDLPYRFYSLYGADHRPR
ncbi:hypothetical protein BCO18175_03791 [Burkholderia contaminans]|uniref:hypothetical protein n=1 Tax=Burkholderia contaminans TaxID=488447 RepID=UPI00145425C2|nr:hypothetical protein [Burkholderia contaminans]VWC97111.1 hypothetical protein BCO18175_03791 [Burkholderia contaminans]